MMRCESRFARPAAAFLTARRPAQQAARSGGFLRLPLITSTRASAALYSKQTLRARASRRPCLAGAPADRLQSRSVGGRRACEPVCLCVCLCACVPRGWAKSAEKSFITFF